MALPGPAKRLLHDAVVREVLRAYLVFTRWDPEKDYSRDAARTDRVHLTVQLLIHGELEHPGHGADFTLDPAAMDHKDRLDEVGSRQLVFTDELPQGSRTPPTARPVGRREWHIRRLERGGTTRNRKWGA